MGYQLVTWPMTSRDPKDAVRSAILVIAWLLVKPEWLTSTCVYLENEKTSHSITNKSCLLNLRFGILAIAVGRHPMQSVLWLRAVVYGDLPADCGCMLLPGWRSRSLSCGVYVWFVEINFNLRNFGAKWCHFCVANGAGRCCVRCGRHWRQLTAERLEVTLEVFWLLSRRLLRSLSDAWLRSGRSQHTPRRLPTTWQWQTTEGISVTDLTDWVYLHAQLSCLKTGPACQNPSGRDILKTLQQFLDMNLLSYFLEWIKYCRSLIRSLLSRHFVHPVRKLSLDSVWLKSAPILMTIIQRSTIMGH